MNKGLTGILRPNGHFISCDYGNHGQIAITIPNEESKFCIYFSSSIRNGVGESLLYLNEEITIAQMLWITNNIDKFDSIQYNVWAEYVSEKTRN